MEYIASLIPFVLIFAIFWYFLIRPQRQKQKDHEEMIENLEVGDQVFTIGGIRAKIIKIKDNIVKLRVSSDVDIEVKKEAIGHLEDSGNKQGQ